MTQLQLPFDDIVPVYYEVSAGGTFEHKSDDCPVHGENECFFRVYKSRTKWYCVKCALAALGPT